MDVRTEAKSTSAPATLRAAGATDPGGRATNEDRFLCEAAGGFFVVADGVGGYAGGAVAAAVACELIGRRLSLRTGTTVERLCEAVAAANNEIYRRSVAEPRLTGMACVLTAAVVEPGRVTVGHVGDTRLYVVDGDGIHKVTRDHSLVGVQEDAGVLTEAEAMRHPRRNEILRDVGSAPHAPDDPGFVDVYAVAPAPGAVLVLCSDGLTDAVPAAAIDRAVRFAGTPEAAANALVALAKAAGTTDNVTVVVVGCA